MNVIGELREEAAKTKAPDVTPLAPAELVVFSAPSLVSPIAA